MQGPESSVLVLGIGRSNEQHEPFYSPILHRTLDGLGCPTGAVSEARTRDRAGKQFHAQAGVSPIWSATGVRYFWTARIWQKRLPNLDATPLAVLTSACIIEKHP